MPTRAVPQKTKKKAEVPLTPAVLMAMINKHYGHGTVVMASDKKLRITRIPCGVLSMDIRLGGGFARGRHFEVFGGYSTGKTALAYRLIANAQKLGLRCAFIDAEGSFDPTFAEVQGVVIKELLLQPKQKHGETIVGIMEMLLRSGIYDVIVLDSISALLPKAERDASMDKGSYGTQQAKMMSAALRRLTAANDKTVLFYINQQREAIGTMFKQYVTSGGRAMAYYAGTRIEMTRIENLKRVSVHIDPKTSKPTPFKEVVAHRCLVRVEKDKTGGSRPHAQSTFVFDYRLGRIDHIEDLIYLGRTYGVVGVKGNFWMVKGFEDEKQPSRAKFKNWLRRNVAVAEELEEYIWDAWANDNEPDVEDTDPEEENTD